MQVQSLQGLYKWHTVWQRISGGGKDIYEFCFFLFIFGRWYPYHARNLRHTHNFFNTTGLRVSDFAGKLTIVKVISPFKRLVMCIPWWFTILRNARFMGVCQRFPRNCNSQMLWPICSHSVCKQFLIGKTFTRI